MYGSIRGMHKQMHRVVLISLVYGDIQSKAGDERAVESFGSSVRLQVVWFRL